ncbi:MAG: thiamine-phosphate kinase [Candidatus Acidiferrales bacterium]
MEAEDQLIERIAKSLLSAARRKRAAGRAELRLKLGMGDDAAILAPGGSTDWILTCDAFIEGIHFLRDLHPADSVGYKSLSRATSDIAAMGAQPRAFLLTLALPENLTGRWLDGFLAGMKRAARILGVRLIGGDTTKSPHVFISITVLGEVPRGRSLARSGARPGDVIYVSGRLGRAQLGLELVRSGLRGRKVAAAASRATLQQHLYPKIRVELGAWLAQSRIASAMMDISDGLSTDLPRLCEASGVGARIDAQRIPCVELPKAPARKLRGIQSDALQLALHGGEDYELLFTIPRRNVAKLRAAPGFSQLTAIGQITRDREILLVDSAGRAGPLKSAGWDPFRKSLPAAK